MQAMIFAAGLGTRLKPLTDTMPKALVPVAGKPLLRHVISYLRAFGFLRIVVNVHHFASQIRDYLRDDPDIVISDESDLLRNTGGALRHAAPLFTDDYVLVHNVDILSNADLTAFSSSPDCAARLLVSHRRTQRYLLFDSDMRLVGWTNEKTGEVKSPYAALDVEHCHKFAFAGIHLISRLLIDEMQHWDESFSVIDFYLSMCEKYRIEGYLQDNLTLIDVGKPDTLSQASAFLNQEASKRADRLK